MIPPLPWKLIGRIAVPAVVVLASVWLIRSYADRVADAREAEVRAEQAADEERATTKHNANIAKINEDHHAASKDLEGRLQAALARPPAVRVVRVQNGAACPAPVTADAGEPATADPGSGSAGEGEADYRVLRDEILRLGADGEKFRQMALDAQAGWPK
jgi:hypothetical protein